MLSIRSAVLMLFLKLNTECYGADILAIIPTASISHQLPFRPLWRQLASRGHNITLVTTDPMRDPTLRNLKEIDMSYAYRYMEKHQVIEIASNGSKSFYEMAVAIRKATNESYNVFFQSPEGQNLIHNKENNFDLLIVEAQLPAMMVFSWWYQIPFIGVSSLDCSLQYHDTAGNFIHPLVTPDANLPIEDLQKLTFWERLQSFIYIVAFKSLIYFLTFPREQKMLKSYFGEKVPTLPEIQNNMSMLFIATNPIFQPIRPLMPNTITIGNGMHMDTTRPLSQDIQGFLDNATQGAIYFSLGSNIMSKHLNDSTRNELLNTLAGIPYRVLWKTDYVFKNLPSSIKVQKWFTSQQDILRHPNIKVFITQGGLQSMQESVYANKPMIGIPFFGDQHMNIKRMVHLGYGLALDKHNITQESLREAITEIITNPKYSQKAQEYGEIFRDVEIPNVEKAVWWTEYVLRHKGARHFRNPLLDMPFWKIYMLDVFGVLILAILLLTALIWFILEACSHMIRRKHNTYSGKKKTN